MSATNFPPLIYSDPTSYIYLRRGGQHQTYHAGLIQNSVCPHPQHNCVNNAVQKCVATTNNPIGCIMAGKKILNANPVNCPMGQM